MHVIASATLLLKYYILKRGKREVEKLGTEELRCTSLCTIHIELYVCMFLLLITWNCRCNCKCWFYMNCNIDICCNCMNICEWTWMNIYATYFTTNKSSSFVFNTVKEPVCSVIRVCTTLFYYRIIKPYLFKFLTFFNIYCEKDYILEEVFQKSHYSWQCKFTTEVLKSTKQNIHNKVGTSWFWCKFDTWDIDT